MVYLANGVDVTSATYACDGFTLRLDLVCFTEQGQRATIAYVLTDDDGGTRAPREVFRGSDLSVPTVWHEDAFQVVNWDRAIGDALSFLSLRPGDTDAEYFANYTPDQLAWAEARGEELSLVGTEFEEAHGLA